MGHPLLDLTDKTAVVIGGTSGIGLALTRALAQAGANVIPTGRRAAQVAAAASEVQALGRRSLAQTCDVTDNGSLTQLLRSVCAEFASVQILVNCAGRTKRMPTLDFPEAEWNDILETNLNGTLRACRVFGRHMIEQHYGRIINIASLGSFVALFEVAAYNASKAAVAALTKSLAVEWATSGVCVNAIAPASSALT
jgi:NAD(P)-dependent dehydrogenase (short-subunit alcohol dehydrogenase family)